MDTTGSPVGSPIAGDDENSRRKRQKNEKGKPVSTANGVSLDGLVAAAVATAANKGASAPAATATAPAAAAASTSAGPSATQPVSAAAQTTSPPATSPPQPEAAKKAAAAAAAAAMAAAAKDSPLNRRTSLLPALPTISSMPFNDESDDDDPEQMQLDEDSDELDEGDVPDADAEMRDVAAAAAAANAAASALRPTGPNVPKDKKRKRQSDSTALVRVGAPPPPAGSPFLSSFVPVVPPGSSRLATLPNDWQFHIMSFLPAKSIAYLSSTSKYFKQLTNNDRVWKQLCMSGCPWPCKHKNHPWKQLFLTRTAKLKDRFNSPEQRKYKQKMYYVCNCCKCVKGFALLADYERHLQVRHGPNRVLPPSSHHSNRAKKQLDPITGAEVKKSETGKDFVCPVPGCGKAFKKPIELKYHYDGVHKMERAYPCDHPNCFKSFVSPAQLALHKCKHTGAARPHKCSRTDLECHKSFNTPSQLEKHEQTHLPRSNREVLKCPFDGCSRSYHSQSAVLKHFATEHDASQLRYRCNDQSLLGVFVQGTQLQTIANTCKAAFYFKATWKEHLSSKHHIEATHEQLQRVVAIMKNAKLMANLGIIAAPSDAAGSTPQELAAAAVSNAIRAASNSNAAGAALPFPMLSMAQLQAMPGFPSAAPIMPMYHPAPGVAGPATLPPPATAAANAAAAAAAAAANAAGVSATAPVPSASNVAAAAAAANSASSGLPSVPLLPVINNMAPASR